MIAPAALRAPNSEMASAMAMPEALAAARARDDVDQLVGDQRRNFAGQEFRQRLHVEQHRRGLAIRP